MACAQLMDLKNPNFNILGSHNFWKEYIQVPCGWCLNCRIDKQNWLSDAMEYEHRKYNYIAAFVTFTYDDIHIYDLINIPKDNFYTWIDDNNKVHYEPYNSNKPVQYSLRRDDARNFLKRIRSKINYLYDKNKIKNVDLCRRDFKVAYTGEYGDLFGRPHYHFVFFGLDYDFCKDIFESCWQNGLIDSLPVKPGCFEYITKYMIKQVHGEQAEQLYDKNNLERPFFCHSLGLGKGLIIDQIDFIKQHNMCYLSFDDNLRPIPIYYRNALNLHRPKNLIAKTNDNMNQACIPPDLDPEQQYRSNEYSTTIKYSIKKINQFRHDQALIRHKKLELQCESKGVPFVPLLEYEKTSNLKAVGIDTSQLAGLYTVIDGEKIPF